MRLSTLFLFLLTLPSCIVVHTSAPEGRSSRRVTYDPEGRADVLPYSHAVRVGDTLYVAGSLGIDPETGRAPEDVGEEVRLMLDAFKKKLELAGADMDDLVFVQVFCSDVALYDQFNAIYATYFDGDFPPRAFVGSGTLLRGGRFEINGIAAL